MHSTPARERLPSLTGLRFWAALLVVLYHLSRQYRPLPWISPLVWYGRDGVTFFFVLSGFVLAWSYATARVRPRVFYWRRLVRIGPLHLLATGLAVAVGLLGAAAVPWRGVLLSLPLLQAWSRATAVAGNPAAWSLSDEAWFYLLLPVLLPLLLRRGDRALTLLAGLAAGCGLLLWLCGSLGPLAGSPGLRGWLLDYLPLSRTPQFLLGAVAGVAVRRGRRIPLPVGAAVAGLVLWHLALVVWHHAVPDSRWYGPYSASQLLVAPLFAALIAAAAGRDLDGRRSRLAGRWSRRLGHWSFAWYLVHQSCLRLLLLAFGAPRGRWAGWAALGGWLLLLTVSLALAALLFHCVERPLESRLRPLVRAAADTGAPDRPVVPGARRPSAGGGSDYEKSVESSMLT